MPKNNDITVPYLLKQYKFGAFTGGLIDVAMERLEELYNASIKPQVFVYEESSLKDEDMNALADRFTMVMYKKGSRPPVIV